MTAHPFDRPYVDIDESRDTPLPHRYVHGGFEGTATRFSLYFPPPESYEGRFYQHITPVPDSEHLAPSADGQEDKIGFAFGAGGYFLETNGGGPSGTPGSHTDPTIAGYRAHAAAAAHSRVVARQVYGDHRPYGYLYGGSGGAFRTMGCAEHTEGVWDGFVPYVPGSPMAIPNVFTVRMHAQRVLRDVFDRIVDAVEPGGSGDPHQGLAPEESAALTEVTRMGFPIRSWFGHRTMGTHAFGTLYPHLVQADPGYFEEFWSMPGYLGADPRASVQRARVRFDSTVSAVLRRRDAADLGPFADPAESVRGGVDEAFKGPGGGGDAVVALRLTRVPPTGTLGAELTATTGEAAGSGLRLKGIWRDLAVVDMPGAEPHVPPGLRPGDTVRVDNSNFLAAQTYHRHQVPGPEYAAWDQYRDATGAPLPPQRPFLLAPLFAAAAAGHVPTGEFAGKMIVVSCLLDREAFPWQAAWYRDKAAEHLGDALDDRFRLWYVDNALHADTERQEHPTRSVSYLGVLHEALRSLADWVEKDIPPATGTRYEIRDGQVLVPDSAADRGGVQPVVRITADGATCADVPTGTSVTLAVTVDAPPGAGPIVRVQWDADGDGTYEIDDVVEPASRLTLERRHTYLTPGTRFAAVRVSAQRDGDPVTPFARVDNVARARIVVRD
ncbi:Tat pathway signal sequence domain protein [Streptomyces sp. NPDC006134]|uniref:Tat pathway signal sequence domain protein n=1 Tax=Streptomyces sp. NPDC006134 TaxID=3154467 RepID=UPI003406D167